MTLPGLLTYRPDAIRAPLAAGDLIAAQRMADRQAALAVLSESAAVRAEAPLVPVGVLALAGEYGRARAGVVGQRSPGESARELGVALLLLYGRTPAPSSILPAQESLAGGPEGVLTEALLADLAGDRPRARRLAAPYLARPAAVARHGLWGLTRLAHLAARLHDRSAARALIALLTRADGPMATLDGLGCDLPVRAHLARLTLLLGDPETAADHARAALAYSLALASRPLQAWSALLLSLALRSTGEYAPAAAARDNALDAADAVGVQLPPDLPVAVGEVREASLVRAGRVWLVRSPLGGGAVPALVGMRQLGELLATGEPRAATDLAGVEPSGVAPGGAGSELDPETRHAYRERLGVLADGEAAGDPASLVAVARVLGEVRRATGLETAEPPGSVLIPQSVGHNLRRAINAIASVAPELGDHLAVSVCTRAWCRYRPAPGAALTWFVDSSPDRVERISS